jgi:hypothetical protein
MLARATANATSAMTSKSTAAAAASAAAAAAASFKHTFQNCRVHLTANTISAFCQQATQGKLKYKLQILSACAENIVITM